MLAQPGLRADEPIVDIEVVVDRRCEFQLELSGERAGATSLQALDASGTPLQVWHMDGGEFSGGVYRSIEGGRTPALTVGKSATTLVVTPGAKGAPERMSIVVRPVRSIGSSGE